LVGLALHCLVQAASTDAAAYCRTTTCDPDVEECKRNAEGCVRDGAALRWRSLPIPYRFDASGSSKLDDAGARDAVRRAFETWSNASCGDEVTSLAFEELPEAVLSKPAGESRASRPFGIFFRDDEWLHDEGEDASLALTNQIFGKNEGFIDYSDIEINTANNVFSLSGGEEGIDLSAVVTHEVGHYIGLAHSREEGSIMAPRFHPERHSGGADASSALAADDLRAVCNLYPPSPSTGEPEPAPAASSCAISAPNALRSNSAPLAGLAVLLLVARRRRSVLAELPFVQGSKLPH
jgi:matrixin